MGGQGHPRQLRQPAPSASRTPTGRAANQRLPARQRPLRRAGTSREVAQAVVYLASEQAAYITGHALPVDGGGVHTWYLWE